MRRLHLAILLVCGVAVAAAVACGDAPDENKNVVDFSVERIAPKTVLPGTELQVHGRGFRKDDSIRIRLEGEVDGRRVSSTSSATFQDSEQISTTLGSSFFANAGISGGRFQGRVVVEVFRGGEGSKRSRDVSLELTDSLEPSIESVEPSTVAFMDEMAINGSGLLLSGEGKTILKANGTFETTEGAEEEIEDLILTVKPGERARGWYVHGPEAFGLRTGTFEGTIAIENWHDGPGGEVAGNAIQVTIEVQGPRVDDVTPKSASRGQRIEIFGQGFVPAESEGRQRTTVALTGTFRDTEGHTESYGGDNALIIDPDYVESGVLEYVIRPDIDDGDLEGLGSEPGVFKGEMRARVHRNNRVMRTEAREIELTILPTKQIIYLKYLPGFSDALRKYGLRNVETQVRKRILEVCERDYREYNVECRTEPPEDYADYLTVQIGGRDPNGGKFFGLDNSEGIDRGNLRLDEIVGGRRATSEKGDRFSYGGVFVESFFAFSPKLSEKIPIESPAFDEIFKPFAPDLGGKPVQTDEFPSGKRTEKIDRAIHALGSLAGNTAVHEAGHAMGLANTGLRGQVHHSGVNPRLKMNSGADRSFEQRAELEGAERGIWGERDSEYLQEILPKP